MSEPAKKLVPNLRFPEFEKLGAWKEISIAQLCETFSGGTPTSTEKSFYGGEIPFIRSAEIASDTTELYLTESGLKGSSAKMVNKGDILVALYGANSGDVAISKINGAINQAILCLQSDSEFRNRFICQYLTYKKSYIVGKYIQGGQGNLSGEIVKTIKIPQPPKISNDDLELKKIADCLSSLDDLINVQNQKVEALKQHKKGLMQQLFPAEGETVPKLRFPEFKNEPWNINPLGKVADNLDYKRVPITESDRKKGTTPYYGASGIIDYVEGYIFEEDLLCISEDGANLVARTYPIAFSISGKSWVNNHAHVLQFKKRFTQIIIENYLNSISLEDYLTGMAQPKLNQAKLELIPIPLPENEDEEQKIADCLSTLDGVITTQTQKLDALRAHKKGLMQQLFPALSTKEVEDD